MNELIRNSVVKESLTTQAVDKPNIGVLWMASRFIVIPAKAGIQNKINNLNPRFHGG